MMASSLRMREVYLVCRQIFAGGDKEIRDVRSVEALLEKHREKLGLLLLKQKKKYRMKQIVGAVHELLLKGVFSSRAQACKHFPDLFVDGNPQNLDREMAAVILGTAVRRESGGSGSDALGESENGEGKQESGAADRLWLSEIVNKVEDIAKRAELSTNTARPPTSHNMPNLVPGEEGTKQDTKQNDSVGGQVEAGKSSSGRASRETAFLMDRASPGKRSTDDDAAKTGHHGLVELQGEGAQEANRESTAPPQPSTLFPMYLPYSTQHRLLVMLQSLLERTFFEFGQKWLPEVLRAQKWECPEALEVKKWTRVVDRYYDELPHEATGAARPPLTDGVNWRVDRLQDAIVHRIPLPCHDIEMMLWFAEELAAMLKDTAQLAQLQRLHHAFQRLVPAMEDRKWGLERRLQAEVRAFEAQQAELRKRSMDVRAALQADDARDQADAGAQLDGALDRLALHHQHQHRQQQQQEQQQQHQPHVQVQGNGRLPAQTQLLAYNENNKNNKNSNNNNNSYSYSYNCNSSTNATHPAPPAPPPALPARPNTPFPFPSPFSSSATAAAAAAPQPPTTTTKAEFDYTGDTAYTPPTTLLPTSTTTTTARPLALTLATSISPPPPPPPEIIISSPVSPPGGEHQEEASPAGFCAAAWRVNSFCTTAAGKGKGIGGGTGEGEEEEEENGNGNEKEKGKEEEKERGKEEEKERDGQELMQGEVLGDLINLDGNWLD